MSKYRYIFNSPLCESHRQTTETMFVYIPKNFRMTQNSQPFAATKYTKCLAKLTESYHLTQKTKDVKLKKYQLQAELDLTSPP